MDNNSPERLFSSDLHAILDSIDVMPVPEKMPGEAAGSANDIEALLILGKEKPNDLAEINFANTLVLPEEFINELTAKLYELMEMMDHADDENYPNKLSRGSIDNVGLSAIRRCFYVCSGCPPTSRPNPYPYVEANADIIKYLSNLFLRIYKSGFRDLLKLYIAIILQLCAYRKEVVKFNAPYPMDNIYWKDAYNNVYNAISRSDVAVVETREWILNPRPQPNQHNQQSQRGRGGNQRRRNDRRYEPYVARNSPAHEQAVNLSLSDARFPSLQ